MCLRLRGNDNAERAMAEDTEKVEEDESVGRDEGVTV